MAHALIKRDDTVTVFLIADAVLAAKMGQKTPGGYYNAERMVRRVTSKGRVLLSGGFPLARSQSISLVASW